MINYYHLEKMPILREGLARMASNTGSIRCVGGSDKANELLACLPDLALDFVLVDMALESEDFEPLAACLALCRKIRKASIDAKIVLHSPYHHMRWWTKFAEVGIKGVISKYSSFEETLDCVYKAASDVTAFCPQIQVQLRTERTIEVTPKNNGAPPKEDDNLPRFSRRERSVLELILKGYTTKAVAETLLIGPKTVETHRMNLVKKAHVKNTAELVGFVCRYGLVI